MLLAETIKCARHSIVYYDVGVTCDCQRREEAEKQRREGKREKRKSGISLSGFIRTVWNRRIRDPQFDSPVFRSNPFPFKREENKNVFLFRVIL